MAFVIVRPATVTACADCAAGLEHCHGSLIEHATGALECTEPGCVEVDPARHALRLCCAELTDCGCGEPATAHRIAS
ncbi:MAG: hypothetical protein J2O49_00945 [Sciscionella sp.]|nr:hypothetical protein [Sciscionella sp.]